MAPKALRTPPSPGRRLSATKVDIAKELDEPQENGVARAVSLLLILFVSFLGFCIIPIAQAILVFGAGRAPPFVLGAAVGWPFIGFLLYWWLIPCVILVYGFHYTWLHLAACGVSGAVVFAIAGLVDKRAKLTPETSPESTVGATPLGSFLALYAVPVAFLLPLCPPSPIWVLVPIGVVALVTAGMRYLQRMCRSQYQPKQGEPVKVLIIGDSFAPKMDGPQVFTSNLVKRLVKQGHNVCILTSICPVEGRPKPEDFGATVVRGMGIKDIYPGHSLTLPDVPALMRTLTTFQPHVVHLFDEAVATGFFAPILWLLDIPVVWSHHSRVDLYAGHGPKLFEKLGPQMIRWVYDVCFPKVMGHLLVDDSQRFQPWFCDLLGGRNRLRFWNSGADLEAFNPKWRHEETRKILLQGAPDDTPVVVFVGRVAIEKQTDLLPEVVRNVLPEGSQKGGKPLCRFVIVGGGPGLDELIQDIGAKEVERGGRKMWATENVLLTGPLHDEWLRRTYASSDIFFSPTVTGTADLVFFESQGAGLAVVGPRIAAVPTVVQEGVHGKLYKPCDMVDAARAIREAVAELPKLRSTTRAHAEKDFSWESVCQEALDMYIDTCRMHWSQPRFFF